MDRIHLHNLKTIKYVSWIEDLQLKNSHRLLISVSGYEARSVHWVSQTIKILKPSEFTNYLTIGFQRYKEKLSRKNNDADYETFGLSVDQLESDEWSNFIKKIISSVEILYKKANSNSVEIHIDYSSMPRNWYCRLPFYLEKIIREQDNVYFWYTPGHYLAEDYPTVGVEDFHIFSGRSTLVPKFRTHIFGLGFDRIRSQGIWSVLDPENLICFYTDPGTEEGYVDKVIKDNRDILLSAKNVFTVPMQDFLFTLSKLVGVVRDYRNIGDVILVPDGPKPLIMASSLVPSLLHSIGITCLHVTRRKSLEYEPIDVNPAGMPYGFSYQGIPAST